MLVRLILRRMRCPKIIASQRRAILWWCLRRNKEVEMLRIIAMTKLSPEEVIKRAVDYFALLGLAVKDHGPNYAMLEGGGGHIEMTATNEKKGASIEFISQEWDIQVKEF